MPVSLSVCRKSLAEFAARTLRSQSNHFFAGSPGEKILLSLLVCPQGARGRLQPLSSEKAIGLFQKKKRPPAEAGGLEKSI
jgi:hypothetical protein